MNTLDMNCKFPKYIWNKNTQTLIISETGGHFIDDSEYGNGPKKFNSIEEAKQYLTNNKLSGNIGIKLY